MHYHQQCTYHHQHCNDQVLVPRHNQHQHIHIRTSHHVSICCCRHAVLPEQAPGAANSQATPSKHPPANTASQVKHNQIPSDVLASGSVGKVQPAGSSSRQPVGLSEELTDLFNSIQQLQQQVAALPQPQQISPSAGAQSGPSNDQVPIFIRLLQMLHLCLLLHSAATFMHTIMVLQLHSHIHSYISWNQCQARTPQLQ